MVAYLDIRYQFFTSHGYENQAYPANGSIHFLQQVFFSGDIGLSIVSEMCHQRLSIVDKTRGQLPEEMGNSDKMFNREIHFPLHLSTGDDWCTDF